MRSLFIGVIVISVIATASGCTTVPSAGAHFNSAFLTEADGQLFASVKVEDPYDNISYPDWKDIVLDTNTKTISSKVNNVEKVVNPYTLFEYYTMNVEYSYENIQVSVIPTILDDNPSHWRADYVWSISIDDFVVHEQTFYNIVNSEILPPVSFYSEQEQSVYIIIGNSTDDTQFAYAYRYDTLDNAISSIAIDWKLDTDGISYAKVYDALNIIGISTRNTCGETHYYHYNDSVIDYQISSTSMFEILLFDTEYYYRMNKEDLTISIIDRQSLKIDIWNISADDIFTSSGNAFLPITIVLGISITFLVKRRKQGL
ncbi:MAG: hypothetical protein INQ03_10770 [Candidatus Heimdallarchaeota archaeon]|nr:hypothetical protein [Candidatus Heimdallarchaeota archaeon]